MKVMSVQEVFLTFLLYLFGSLLDLIKIELFSRTGFF